MNIDKKMYCLAFYTGLKEQINLIKTDDGLKEEFNKNPLEYLEKVLDIIKDEFSGGK